MATVYITISGLDKVGGRLDSLRIGDVLRNPMYRAVLRIQADMQKYPPQRAGARYRRTGTLGRRWTTRVTSSGNSITGTVGNNTSYGPFVQSQRFQARIHRGLWQTDAQVVERNIDVIVDDFRAAIRSALAAGPSGG